MPAEGRWITWRDRDGAEQIARADVPGNESATGPRLTPEQLARSIAWTRAHPEWLAEAQQEADARADDAARLGAPAGQFRYVDSRTGEFFTAAQAPDPQHQWRLVATENEVRQAFQQGEVAAQVPTDFDLAGPQEQLQLVRDSIIRDYEEGARYQQQLRQLQERWGVDPAPPEGLPRPEQMPPVEDLGPVEPDEQDTPEPPPGPESTLRPRSIAGALLAMDPDTVESFRVNRRSDSGAGAVHMPPEASGVVGPEPIMPAPAYPREWPSDVIQGPTIDPGIRRERDRLPGTRDPGLPYRWPLAPPPAATTGLTPLSPEQTAAVQVHLERKQNGAGPSLGPTSGYSIAV